jgi:hypothetical protein
MSDNSFAGINFDNPKSKIIFETQSKMMCPSYKTRNENSFIDNIQITENNSGSLLISGNVSTNSSDKYYIKYTAANPPTFSTNYSGSGLPYPTEDVAFENTPNRGIVEVVDSKFSFNIKYPNSYYINMGTVYVEPNVKIILVDKDNKQIGKHRIISLGQGIPFRTLTWPRERNWNVGPLFYKVDDLPVRSQYQILVDSAYPSINKVPANFWGLDPPH